MATLTIQITAGAQVSGRVKTISNTDLTTRYLPAIRKALGIPNATDIETGNAWADWVVRQSLDLVKGVEQTTAINNATAGVSDIPLT